MGRRQVDISSEEICLRLRQAVAEMPNLGIQTLNEDLAKWFAQVCVLVEQIGDLSDTVALKGHVSRFGSVLFDAAGLQIVLYRALARVEAMAPAAARGRFIPAGKPLDALIAVTGLLAEAKKYVLIVDAYADANLLTEFLVAVPEAVTIHVLTDQKSLKPTLKPTMDAWIAQHGPRRPLVVKVAPKGSLHDRLIFIDDSSVWMLGQSFNQLAKRAPTSLAQADPDLTKMKHEAYATIWQSASEL